MKKPPPLVPSCLIGSDYAAKSSSNSGGLFIPENRAFKVAFASIPVGAGRLLNYCQLADDILNKEWWRVQNPVESLTEETFRIDAGVGDEKSPPGSRYQIVVVVAKSKEEFTKFVEWSDHESLPVNGWRAGA